MAPFAFTASVALTNAPAFTGRAVNARRPAVGTALTMSAADNYMARTVTRRAKEAATTRGIYSVQCTEGTGGCNTADSKRLAVVTSQFRLRQCAPSAAYGDLFATRKAAIISAAGSHVDEGYAVSFPARAAAGVAGRAEALRACNRYFGSVGVVEEYMNDCVDRQYKALKAPYGTYTVACCDGITSGEAETARVSALAADFRAKHFYPGEKAQMRYNAAQEAIAQGRGCTYEEDEWIRFPKMAGAMRASTGAYAAFTAGAAGMGVGKLATIEERVSGEEVKTIWPSFERRPAIKRTNAPWMPSPIKDYSYMSQAAVQYGIDAQTEPFVDSEYAGWYAGWKPASKIPGVSV